MSNILNDLIKRAMNSRTPEEAEAIEADRMKGLMAIPSDPSIDAYPDDPNWDPETADKIKNQGMMSTLVPERKISLKMPEEMVEAQPSEPASFDDIYPKEKVKGIGLKPVPREFPLSPAEQKALDDKNTKPLVPETTPISTEQEDTELKKALALRDSREELDAFLRAMAGLGNAVGGRGFTQTDTSPIDAFSKLNDKELRNLQTVREEKDKDVKRTLNAIGLDDAKKSADPKSELSAISRQAIVTALRQAGDPAQADRIEKGSLSHNQLVEVYGKMNLSNILTNYLSRETQKEIANRKIAADAAKKDDKKEDTNFKREQALSKQVDTYIKNTGYRALDANIKVLKEKLKAGKFTGVDDITSIYSFIRGVDPGSVVRTEEGKMLLEASPYLQKVMNIPAKITEGDILSAAFRKKIIDGLETLKKARQSEYEELVGKVDNAVVQYGLNKDNIFPKMQPTTVGLTAEQEKRRQELLAKKQKAGQ